MQTDFADLIAGATSTIATGKAGAIAVAGLAILAGVVLHWVGRLGSAAKK